MVKAAVLVLSIAAVVAIAFMIQISVWRECRAEDHSFFYCLALVSR